MELTRENIIAEARKELGTKFLHQGRVSKVGLDCAGLVIKTAEKFNLDMPKITNYAYDPDKYMFKTTVEAYTDKITKEEAKIGDLIIFGFLTEPQHIAIITNIEPLTIIHSYAGARKVVEHILDDNWTKKIRGFYRFKGIKE